MRDLHRLDDYRMDGTELTAGWRGDGTCGAFKIPSVIDAQPLIVIASTGEGWDHVSVSRQKRVPNWYELEQIKRAFFRDDEVAMQLHVPVTAHRSLHPHTLHLWRPNDGRVIPMPPEDLV